MNGIAMTLRPRPDGAATLAGGAWLLALGSTGCLTDLPHAAPSLGQRLRVRFPLAPRSRDRHGRLHPGHRPPSAPCRSTCRTARPPSRGGQIAGVVDDAMLPYMRLNAVPLQRAEVLAWREGPAGPSRLARHPGTSQSAGRRASPGSHHRRDGSALQPQSAASARRDDLVDRRRLTAGS